MLLIVHMAAGPLRAYRYVRVLRAGRNGCSRDRTTSHRFNKVGRNVPYLCGSVEAETLHNFAIAVVGDIVLDLDNPRGYCSSLPTKIPSTIAGGVRRTASGYCQRWRLRADCPAPRQGTLPIRKGASLPPTARLLGWTAIDSVNAGTWHSIHSMPAEIQRVTVTLDVPRYGLLLSKYALYSRCLQWG